MSLYAFHLGQIVSTVLGQVDHGDQGGNAARTGIRDETSETDHIQKRRLRHDAICRTIKALAILRCLYSSEMVLLGVVIRKCEIPTTNILLENGHGILMIKCQFVAYNCIYTAPIYSACRRRGGVLKCPRFCFFFFRCRKLGCRSRAIPAVQKLPIAIWAHVNTTFKLNF